MDFLANENFPKKSITILRKCGHSIASIIEETPGAKDINILIRAQKENRIILTFDRDYGELIYRYKSKIQSGIVYFKFSPSSPEEPAEIILNILSQNDISLLGKFTVIEKDRIRQRIIHE